MSRRPGQNDRVSHESTVKQEAQGVNPLETVVVFGGSGFIGSAVVKATRDRLKVAIRAPSSATCDLTSAEAALAGFSTSNANTTVVLCAGVTPRDTQSEDDYHRNVEMAQNVILGLPKTGIRSLIYVSTVDVYGRGEQLTPISESTTANPPGAYASSMATAEWILTTQAEVTGPVSVLRMTQAYGPGDHDGSVISRFIRDMREGRDVLIQGNGSATRDFVYIEDAAEVITHFIEHPAPGTINVASGTSHSINDVAEISARSLKVAPKIKYIKHDGVEAAHNFDTSHLRSLYPGVYFRPLEAGIESHVPAHYRAPRRPGISRIDSGRTGRG